jgi:hypothetical protein
VIVIAPLLILRPPKPASERYNQIVADSQIQYVSDETGRPVSVLVPIQLWCEIESERENACLLRSAKMKERLLRAMSRKEGIPLEEALEKLGVRP